VSFFPAVATIPGSTYTIYPQGTGTWLINESNDYPNGALAGMVPPGGCWSSGWDSAFSVNCDPPDPTPWECVSSVGSNNNNYNVPIRINSAGNVECMAPDGANCLWSVDGCAATLASPPSNLNPLSCGPAHYALYGITGYADPTHWCFIGWEAMKPWLCLPSLTSPVRLNPEGNVECLATDGKNCEWGSVSCSEIIVADPSGVAGQDPLVCGADHDSIYGITGYDDTSHWCYQSIQQLEPVCMNNGQVSFCSGSQCTGTYPCPLEGS